MANTRNSQKKENDEAGAPVAADSKDSSNDAPTMSDLFRLMQAQGEELRSQNETLQSELRSIEAKFDERVDKIESTSEHHEAALRHREEAFLSLSTD